MLYKEMSGQGEDLVILHGWSYHHRSMQPIFDLLKERYRITMVDLPGMGQSDWDSNIQTINDIADLVLPHLPEKAIYVAWSFGGLITISIAARFPERVKRFIGIATTPKFIETKGWPAVPKPGFKAIFSKIRDIGYQALIKSFYDKAFESFDPKPTSYEKLITLLKDSDANPDILLKGIDICDATDLRNEFQRMQCPIDLIMGEDDENVPSVTFEAIKSLNTNVQIHPIQSSGHMPFWTHPKKFNEILNRILK